MEKPTINTTHTRIKEAISFLKKGKPIAFPTETVYGLGAPVFLPETIEKIYALKRRPLDNPLIVHVSNLEQVLSIVKSFPEELVTSFWPGPLTLILPKRSSVPSIASAGLSTIGVRMPSHPLALELIEAVGPLVAPSANLSGSPSSTTAAHVRDDFGDQVFVLDGGPCHHGIESTVLTLDPPTILRPGSITKEMLEEVLRQEVRFAREEAERPLSPGMKYKHYAPRAKVRLVEAGERIFTQPKRLILQSIRPEELYACFREADRKGYEEIIIRCDHTIKSNEALLNRLIRAAH